MSAEPSGTEAFCPECDYTTVVFVSHDERMPICPECGESKEKDIHKVGDSDPVDTVEYGGPRLREDVPVNHAAEEALGNVDGDDP